MNAIAFQLPDEVERARDGIVAFARQEVIPRHERNRAFFEDPRKLYREDGVLSDEAVGLIREVRDAPQLHGHEMPSLPELPRPSPC